MKNKYLKEAFTRAGGGEFLENKENRENKENKENREKFIKTLIIHLNSYLEAESNLQKSRF
nr:hypothetical protein [Campylobacter jejuni]